MLESALGCRGTKTGDGMSIFRALWRDQSGIASIEYAMLTAVIAVGVVLAVSQLSGAVSVTMDRTAGCLDGSLAPSNCGTE